MKKPFRPQMLAWPLLTAPLFVNAQSSVQVNGQIRTSINRVEIGNSSYQELRDNASRLGFKGAEDLGGGLKALFGLELGLEADTGTLSTPNFRHSYVGLGSSTFGTIALGRLDSSAAGGSPLYSQVASITSFAANDAGVTAIGTNILNARNRTSNSIGYMSPTYAGFDVRARYYLRGAGTAAEGEDDAKSFDLGLNYAYKDLKLALGYATDRRTGGLRANEFDDKWQIGVRYDFGFIEPYALYGVDRYNATATTRGAVNYWIIGTRFQSGPHAVVINVMQRDVQTSQVAERRRQQIAYMYALSKRTELQAFVDNDGVDSTRTNVRVRAMGFGVRHNC